MNEEYGKRYGADFIKAQAELANDDTPVYVG